MLGMPQVAGPSINQACATGARVLQVASQEVAAGMADCALVMTADRCSNGPHIFYPMPHAPGGTGEHENWVLDNFSKDPMAGCAMLQTAENVALKHGISKSEQDDVVLRRFQQYQDACANDNAFHKRFMSLPFEVPNAKLTRTMTVIAQDEGVFPTTAEGLAALKPVIPAGTVTFGGQTHPADGNAGLVVTTQARAQALSSRSEISIEILGFGLGRADLAFMPEAPVPAVRALLRNTGLEIKDFVAVKSHNPFAVNDIVFARTFGFDLQHMNNFGSSLIWGHPQAPTGLRAVIELIEELALRGGGIGMFQGCAAGDSAMALAIAVKDHHVR
jgi:acetyl-CoA acetyltransferase